MEIPIELATWIERLGGWGVMALMLVVGGKWALRRIDRALDQMETTQSQMADSLSAFRAAIRTMQDSQRLEENAHNAILQRMDAVVSKIDTLREEVRASSPAANGGRTPP